MEMNELKQQLAALTVERFGCQPDEIGRAHV